MQIYSIQNSINGKRYIGQTIRSFERRWICHLSDAKNKKNTYKFANALRKYEQSVWIKEILEEITDISLLNEREIFWISYYDSFNNGYNTNTGGNQPTEYSEEYRQKKSEIAKKRNFKPWLGKKRPEEDCIKMSLSRIGKVSPKKGKTYDTFLKSIAKSYKVDKKTIYNWIRSGKIYG
jgi:group I intron endonuclease